MKALAFFLALLMLPSNAQAGTTGNLSGFVRDDRGAPIENAMVKVVAASESRSAKTDSNGFFVLMALSPDSYTVSVERDGYMQRTTAGLLITSDSSSHIVTKLRPTCLCEPFVTSYPTSTFVSGDRLWDSYLVPRFLIESQIP